MNSLLTRIYIFYVSVAALPRYAVSLSAFTTPIILSKQKDVKDRFNNDPKAYLDNIVDMTSGVWQLEASNWTFCDPDKNQEAHPWESTKLITSLCPIEWARDMNQLNCQFVWKDYDEDRDYSQDYFETMTGKDNGFMVQKLIAMSGVRMAAILNQIYDPR